MQWLKDDMEPINKTFLHEEIKKDNSGSEKSSRNFKYAVKTKTSMKELEKLKNSPECNFF